MKKLILSFAMLLTFLSASAQKDKLHRLKEQLANHSQRDTFRVNRLNDIARQPDLSTAGRDSAADEALILSRQINYKEGEARALMTQAQTKDVGRAIELVKQALDIAEKSGSKRLISQASSSLGARLEGTDQKGLALHYFMNGIAVAQSTTDKALLASAQEDLSNFYSTFNIDIVKAFDWGLQGLHTAEQSNNEEALIGAWGNMATVYSILGDDTSALSYNQKALEANKKIGNTGKQIYLLMNKGELYWHVGKYKEALQALEEVMAITDDTYKQELAEIYEAGIYEQMGDYPTAKKFALSALNRNKKSRRLGFISLEYGTLACISLHTGNPDSALYYGHLGYEAAMKIGYLNSKRNNAQVLADAYAQKKIFDKAYTFQKLYVSYRDSMMNSDIQNHVILVKYNANLQQKQAEITLLNKDKQLQKAEAQRQYYLLVGALTALLLIAALVLVLYRNNRSKQRANNLLQEQKSEIQHQRDQTSQALTELKSTQAQLIQSEKMASLGELTAGIAHEIQNPLNFVNNFSEVNKELLMEIKEEMDKGDLDEVKLIVDDVISNEDKIIHHGKRADSIVKGMLQHSRVSSGRKELTDINALVDECLRLSYHGLRAKNKEFNAAIKTDFDGSIGKINIVPQDISRGLLNLFNNAFYAVDEKKRQLNGKYEPAFSVCTKKLDGKVEIHVKDNGNGIPTNIVDKIFQPFFTTKPTGQGTGLGLSLSYDIIKAHGGEIKVESKEGEGTEFIICLPA